MLYDPTAVILSDQRQRQFFNSALPDAPVVADRASRPRHPRNRLFAGLGGVLRISRPTPRVA